MKKEDSIERYRYIDIARALGMMWVVGGHLNMDYHVDIVRSFMTVFHMPLFFFLGGLTIHEQRTGKELFSHIKKRFFLLYVPYIIFCFLFGTIQLETLNAVLWGSNVVLGRSTMSALWFFPCYFFSDIITSIVLYIGTKFERKRLIYYIYILAICIMSAGCVYFMDWIRPKRDFPATFDSALLGMIFMLSAKILSKSGIMNKLCEVCQKWWKAIILVFVSMGFTFIDLLMNMGIGHNIDERVVMALSHYGNIPLFILGGILGSMFCVFVALFLDNFFRGKILVRIGQLTLLILPIHIKVNTAIESIYKNYKIDASPVFWILNILLSIIISYYIAEFILVIYKGQHRRIHNF